MLFSLVEPSLTDGADPAPVACSRCRQHSEAAALIGGAAVCAGCLTSPEMAEHGEPLHGRLRAEFQRRYRANPNDKRLDEIFTLIEEVDVGLLEAKLSIHAKRWGVAEAAVATRA